MGPVVKEEVKCEDCQFAACYEKVNGVLVPRKCHSRRYFKRAYADLLVGSKPQKEIAEAASKIDISRNCLVYYPHSMGATRVAALLLLRMQVSIFRQMHTHFLVDVYVSNSEDDKSLKEMFSPFFLLLHGIIPTPNRRLTDLILEFLSYRLSDGVPFMLFAVQKPEPPIENFFRENALPQLEIRSQKDLSPSSDLKIEFSSCNHDSKQSKDDP